MIDIEQAKDRAERLMGNVAVQLEAMAKQLKATVGHVDVDTAGTLKGIAETLESRSLLLQREAAMLVKSNRAGAVAVTVVGAVVMIAILRFLATGRQTT